MANCTGKYTIQFHANIRLWFTLLLSSSHFEHNRRTIACRIHFLTRLLHAIAITILCFNVCKSAYIAIIVSWTCVSKLVSISYIASHPTYWWLTGHHCTLSNILDSMMHTCMSSCGIWSVNLLPEDHTNYLPYMYSTGVGVCAFLIKQLSSSHHSHSHRWSNFMRNYGYLSTGHIDLGCIHLCTLGGLRCV